MDWRVIKDFGRTLMDDHLTWFGCIQLKVVCAGSLGYVLQFAWSRNVLCELTAIQEEHGIVIKVFANDVRMHVRIVNDEYLTLYIFSTLWTLMLTLQLV